MKKIIIMLLIIIPLKVNAISASSYIVMDTDNNRVLEGSNINKRSLIASITKIMTSMVVIDMTNVNKTVTIGDEVLKSFGSGIYVSVGEKISVINLLYGLMLRSGNDAAIALAYYTAGNMDNFAYLMNNKAKDIGMNNTTFVNSSGLEDGDKANYSTVYDMALLSGYAINNSLYKQIVGTKDITVKTDLKTYVWHNKNKLLSSYKYCVGGKTGFTEKARRTLVTNASKDGVNLTVVTFNDGNDFGDHKDLYEKYFDVLKEYEILSEGPIKTKYDNTYLSKSFKMSLTKDEYKKLKKEIIYYDDNASNIIGKVKVSLNDKEYFTEDIYIKKEVKEVKLNFFQKLIKRIKELW
ncbi:MAG: D-alanyl-D-alanine carboxypeptidase family protein [bacterium]|nr:D-alanyl-D-alanine carboxypeptidase family protein [bacterium]